MMLLTACLSHVSASSSSYSSPRSWRIDEDTELMEKYPLPNPTFEEDILGSPTHGDDLNIAMEEIWAELSRDEFDEAPSDHNVSPSVDVTSYFDDITLFDDITDTFPSSTSLLDHTHHRNQATSFYFPPSSTMTNSCSYPMHHHSMPNVLSMTNLPAGVSLLGTSRMDYSTYVGKKDQDKTLALGSPGINHTSPILPSRTDTNTEHENQIKKRQDSSNNRVTTSVSNPDYYYYNHVRNNLTINSNSRSFTVPRPSVMVPPPSPCMSSAASSPRKRKAKASSSNPCPPSSQTPIPAVKSMGNTHSSSGRKTRKMHMMLSDLVQILQDLKKSDIRIHDLAAGRHRDAGPNSQISNPVSNHVMMKSSFDRKKVSISILEILFGVDSSREIPLPQRVCSSQAKFAFPQTFTQSLTFLANSSSMDQGMEEEKKESPHLLHLPSSLPSSPTHHHVDTHHPSADLGSNTPFSVPSEAMSFAEALTLGVTIYKAMTKICSPLFPRSSSMTRASTNHHQNKRLQVYITEDQHIDHHFFVTDIGFTFPFHLSISIIPSSQPRVELQLHGMLKCLESDDHIIEVKVVFDPCDFIRQCIEKGLSSLTFEEIIAGTMNTATGLSSSP